MSVVPPSSALVDVNGPTDSALSHHLAQVAVGSETSFAVLYDEFAPIVHGISTRVARSPEEAEAITVDTFEFLWRHATRLRTHSDVCRVAGAVALLTARRAAIAPTGEVGSHG